MFAAAMLDALPELKPRVFADARAVLPPEMPGPTLHETSSSGIRALNFGLPGTPSLDDHHSHDHGTGFRALRTRIASAPLSAGTSERAIAILLLLAEVEARIHGVAVEDVHFHEIAGWDSLVDVVAAGSIAAALPAARWNVSALPKGGGIIHTQHGLLPAPAPATMALLKGFEWRDDGVSGERVTPTGAAILRHLVTSPVRLGGCLVAEGTGAGTRTLPGLPNVLRALLFADRRAESVHSTETVVVITFDVDDMTGEECAVAADRLRACDGIIDVSFTNRVGKKGRPMQTFQVLVAPPAEDPAVERCFLETSTIGLRVRTEKRIMLPRRQAAVDVDGAAVGVKTVRRSGAVETAKAESDDLRGDSLFERRRSKAKAEDLDRK